MVDKIYPIWYNSFTKGKHGGSTMRLITLKRISEDATFEVVYKDAQDEIQTLAIAEDDAAGQELTDFLVKFNRGGATTADLNDLLEEILDLRPINQLKTGLASLSESDDEKSVAISAKIKLVNNSELLVGGHVVEYTLGSQILRMIEARAKNAESVPAEDWLSLINFTEALYENMNANVRDQLYAWLNYQIQNGRLTITPDGKFLGYKGCQRNELGGIESIHSGPGIVNGIASNGHLSNDPGNVVEMARETVNDNPEEHCSTGLHVGSYDYASSFGSVVVLVEVDPRDVVSVPYDYNGQKLRACKYKVIKEVSSELEEFTLNFDEEERVGVFNEVKSQGLNSEETEELVGLISFDNVPNRKIAHIVYVTEKGQLRTYTDVILESVGNDLFTILTDEGYRSLKFYNVRELKIN